MLEMVNMCKKAILFTVLFTATSSEANISDLNLTWFYFSVEISSPFLTIFDHFLKSNITELVIEKLSFVHNN